MNSQELHPCIALFRGINVGKTRSLPMKDLVRILEDLGFEGVKTYIQSGNVVFQCGRECSAEDADGISAAVEKQFGFRPNVMLLSKSQIDDAVARNPFPTDEGKFLHFFFLAAEPDNPDLDALDAVKTETEQFSLVGRVFYLYTPDGFGKSKLAERAERKIGVPATARNFNTVRQLIEMSQV